MVITMSNVLLFDIPRENNTLEKRINRELHNIKARMIQHSVWKSDNINDLIRIANEIKKFGGKAIILEEKLIFH